MTYFLGYVNMGLVFRLFFYVIWICTDCFLKAELRAVSIHEASGLGEKLVSDLLLKDCPVFGAEVGWGTGKRSWERNPGNTVSELSTKYLIILGYKLYFVIRLLAYYIEKKKSIYHLLFRTCQSKLKLTKYVSFIRFWLYRPIWEDASLLLEQQEPISVVLGWSGQITILPESILKRRTAWSINDSELLLFYGFYLLMII